ncbi:hypothetical protein EIN11_05410 [Salmonella enterica]|nr:hypothetical protein [Salmonella enterica]EDR1736172.1 hypothetical protein [Salmonella enterica subsp. diarizonae]EDT8255146.1 hypothetical protein [Salmonella enterica subsp. diarizonae serovar 48:z52:z]EAR4762297.1 hypothetical protein [Salmonella enterica]EBC2827803.1 hypothetical protein [Salmonella enterica]
MPLPLREYYPIARAAELLECTIDDLIHWAMNGCIRIYLRVEHGYALVYEEPLSDIIGFKDFSLITADTKYHDRLVELDKEKNVNEEKSDEGWQIYFLAKAEIIYDAMNDYMQKNDISCFDDRFLNNVFYSLEYFFKFRVTDEYCNVSSAVVAHEIFECDTDEYCEIKKLVDFEDERYIATMYGFFGLGECFFEYDIFHNTIVATQYCDEDEDEEYEQFPNGVYMSDSDLYMQIISRENVRFDEENLFILKKDFNAIQMKLKEGGELEQVYTTYRDDHSYEYDRGLYIKIDSKNNEIISKKEKTSRKERVSRKARLALKTLILKHYPDIVDNPTKIANSLTSEAKDVGLGDIDFDHNTVKRWIDG